VLATEVAARYDIPPFANSSMDGYAVRVAEAGGARPDQPVTLPVSADIPAGFGRPAPLAPGTAARIMTGAPLPLGADAVVPVEETDDRRERAGEPAPARVQIRVAPDLGANVRPAGQDVRAGQVVLTPGTVISPAVVGVLAGLGASQVEVFAQPLVVVFSTGDELRPVEDDLGPGQIHDTNSHTLAAAAAYHGARVVRLAIAPDRLEAVRARLVEACQAGADMIMSSAGVSVGAYDVVKAAVEEEGELSFWRVRMRPGKPLAFGQVRGVPFFGLPGNPVSALVGFEVFVRPAILKLAGRRAWDKLSVVAELAEPVASDGRETYVRVIVTRRGNHYVARTSGNQGSAVMSAFVRANGLLVLPEGVRQAAAGERFTVWLLDGADSGPGVAEEG
jgi:molybdopterin molybdotransferase